MTDHYGAIQTALLAIPAIASVTRGQPDRDAALPCVAYALQDGRERSAYDDAAYLRRSVYALRLFGGDMAALDALAETIDESLTALGFRRVFAADSPDDRIKQKTLRYEIMD